MNWLMTLRGIPQLYYGDEVLMKNFKNPSDAEVRKDFPGGWPGDAENKFIAAGRTDKEMEAFNYIKALAGFRKNSTAITTGKMMQYLPKDGLYIYFRYDNSQTVMVVTNTGSSTAKPDWGRYAERVAGFRQAKNVVTGKVMKLADIEIGTGESFVFELLR